MLAKISCILPTTQDIHKARQPSERLRVGGAPERVRWKCNAANARRIEKTASSTETEVNHRWVGDSQTTAVLVMPSTAAVKVKPAAVSATTPKKGHQRA
ncbi:hypothetical protein GN244_ATG10306 [Phytophthora infestans]|uniref:Uncharacterized protein n=1 Tax=Phytophthora infestans TaxID=4787 RepID=A0A833S111_PHYIN|nr:hypothetical protein GN244_ATG10306 [Phytophthora infestans]